MSKSNCIFNCSWEHPLAASLKDCQLPSAAIVIDGCELAEYKTFFTFLFMVTYFKHLLLFSGSIYIYIYFSFLFLSAFQKLPQNDRVSQSLNGDLYFSNVILEDTRDDYICYARFNHTQTIQQKQPISLKVVPGKYIFLNLYLLQSVKEYVTLANNYSIYEIVGF